MILSRKWFAKKALELAQTPQRTKDIATTLNKRLNLPHFTEEQEQVIFEGAVGIAIGASLAALEGKPIIQALSQRETTIACLEMFADDLEAIGGDAVDLKIVPDWMEKLGGPALAKFIRETVIPWANSAAVLQ